MNWTLLVGAIAAVGVVYFFHNYAVIKHREMRPMIGWLIAGLLLILVGHRYPPVLTGSLAVLAVIGVYYFLSRFKRLKKTKTALWVVGSLSVVLLLLTWASFSNVRAEFGHHNHSRGISAGGGGQDATAGNTTPNEVPVNVQRTCNGVSQLQYCLDEASSSAHPLIDAFCSASQAQCQSPAVFHEVEASAFSIADLSGEPTKILEVNGTGTELWYSFSATPESNQPSFLWTSGRVITCTKIPQNVFGVVGPNGVCEIAANTPGQ